MIKNIGKFALLLALLTLAKASIKLNSVSNTKETNLSSNSNLAYSKLPENFPTLGKNFIGFKEALAFKESQGNYFAINQLGYLGKYQFGRETLKTIGVYNTNIFLKDPHLQEKAFVANLQRNKWILRKDIKRFEGLNVNGFTVTESGILAAAHLAGPGNVKKYLRSFGATGFEDANGASVAYYMKKFSGYDTSSILPNKTAKVEHVRSI